MKTFKDCISDDMESFFNVNEFAEHHSINGRLLKIVLDNEHLMERSKVEYEGVAVGDILYFVTANEYGKPPKIGEVQTFDRVPCNVFDVRIDTGVYEIILKKNVS